MRRVVFINFVILWFGALLLWSDGDRQLFCFLVLQCIVDDSWCHGSTAVSDAI